MSTPLEAVRKAIAYQENEPVIVNDIGIRKGIEKCLALSYGHKTSFRSCLTVNDDEDKHIINVLFMWLGKKVGYKIDGIEVNPDLMHLFTDEHQSVIGQVFQGRPLSITRFYDATVWIMNALTSIQHTGDTHEDRMVEYGHSDAIAQHCTSKETPTEVSIVHAENEHPPPLEPEPDTEPVFVTETPEVVDLEGASFGATVVIEKLWQFRLGIFRHVLAQHVAKWEKEGITWYRMRVGELALVAVHNEVILRIVLGQGCFCLTTEDENSTPYTVDRAYAETGGELVGLALQYAPEKDDED